MKLLRGKVAWITGAGGGIGRAVAMGLASHGAAIAATDSSRSALAQTLASIQELAVPARRYVMDVTRDIQCQKVADAVAQDLGPVDIVVNCAGVLLRERISDPDALMLFRKTLDVNVTGCYATVRACREQLARTKGCIVNFASIQSFVAVANSTAYTASKGAVRQLTKALAVELAADGIRVNAIAPGYIATPMNEATRRDAKRMRNVTSRVPLGRIGQPVDIVGPTVFLASDLARYITGVTLPVDGGYLCL